MPLRWVALVTAGIAAVVAGTLVLSSGDGSTESLLSEAPQATAVVTATPTQSVAAVPEPSSSTRPSSPRATPESTREGLPAGCQGPLKPGEMADASCDAVSPHTGLPHPCIDPYHGCAWPDATGW